MAASSTWTSLKLSPGAAGMPAAVLSAMDCPGAADGHVRDAQAPSAETPDLPPGFVPLRQVRHLALLGRWPLLEDGMPACLPMKALRTMRFRFEQGDREADVWLRLYAQAYAGDPEAQRLFGRACENGACRAPADRQRALFWYHRAALHGDVEAGMAVERLRQITHVSPAVTAAPSLVHPGLWRITARSGKTVNSKSLFELKEDGAASGYRIGSGGVAAELIGNALKPFAAPYSQSLFLPVIRNVGYEGRWAYYPSRHILALDVAASAAGMPESRSESWHIEVTGCKIGALCGRDLRGSTYILEYSVPAKGREE